MNRLPTLARRCAAVSVAAVISIKSLFAGWSIDPDFNPLIGYGFLTGYVDSVQPDGKILINPGYTRLLTDGTVDPDFSPSSINGRMFTYASPVEGLISIWQFYGPHSTTTVTPLDEYGNPTGSGGSTISGLARVQYLEDGKILALGSFSSIDGMPRFNVARLNADGSLDTIFDAGSGPNPSPVPLYGALQPDGKILIGGAFDSFSGFARPGLVRLNNDGTIDTSFDPTAIVSGQFPSAEITGVASDALNRPVVADGLTLWRFSADGTSAEILTEFEGSGAPFGIDQVKPLPTGKLLVSGLFSKANGESHTNFVRINEDGSPDSTFNAGVNAPVFGSPLFVQPDGRIILHTGSPVATIRLLPDGEVDPTFQPDVPGLPFVSATAAANAGKIYVGGLITNIDGTPRSSLALLNSDGSLDAAFDPGTGLNIPEVTAGDIDRQSPVEALAIQPDGKLLAGGRFTVAQGIFRTALARFNSDGSVDPTLDAQLNDGAEIVSVAVQSDGKILIGGTFSSLGGTPASGVARLLPDGTIDGSFPITTGITGQNAGVAYVHVSPDDRIVIAGTFDAWNGTRRWNLVRLNADGTLDTTFDPGSETATMPVLAASANVSGTVAMSGNWGATLIDENAEIVFTTSLHGSTNAVTTSPSGGLIAASSDEFTLIETFTETGELDTSLAPEFSPFVRYDQSVDSTNPLPDMVSTLSQGEGNSIFATGKFTIVDGLSYTGIARFIPTSLPPSLGSLSTRGYVGEGEEIMIAGLVIKGTERQRVMLRGIGWNLEEFGITDRCEYPQLAVFRAGETTPFAGNYVWFNPYSLPVSMRLMQYFDRFQAFPLKYNNDLGLSGSGHNEDSAILLDLEPGAYTVHVPVNVSGVGLVEVYDVNGIGADRGLISLSTRGLVQTDERALIGGLNIIGGTKRMLIRAVGPGLEQFGVGNILVDPKLDLVRQSDGATIASNDQWESDGNGAEIAEAEVITGAFPLDPGSLDSALLIDLPPGAYTAIVSGVEGTEGVALVEFYEVPSL